MRTTITLPQELYTRSHMYNSIFSLTLHLFSGSMIKQKEIKVKVLILMKFPLFGAGSGSYTRRLVESLAKNKDIEIAIAAPDSRKIPGAKVYQLKPPFRAIFEGHPELKGARRFSRLSGEQVSRLYTSNLKQMIDIVEDFKPDVIHVNHAHYMTWIASFIKSFYGIAYVVTIHGTGVYQCTIDRRFRMLTRQALERAEYILPVAPHSAKWTLKLFGSKLSKKIKVIPGGIDTTKFLKSRSTKSFEAKYNLKGKKLVIFVGRLTKEKGIEYLISAAENIDAEIFIIGGGPYKKYLQNYTKISEVTNVHFLGYFGREYLSELKEFYSRADVLVVPSIVDESLGLVILEAMAANTPVVASNKGGIPLVVKDGKNGILVRAKSSKGIIDAVNKLLNNPQLAKKMGINARETVMNKFDWVNISPEFVKIYEKVHKTTNKLRDSKLAKQRDIFDQEDIEREAEELQQKIGYIS